MNPPPFLFPRKSNNNVCGVVNNAVHQKPNKGIRRVFTPPPSLLLNLPKSSSSCDSFFRQHHQQQQQQQQHQQHNDAANDGSMLRTLLDRMDGLSKVRLSASASASASAKTCRWRMLEPNAFQGRHQIIGQNRGSSGSPSKMCVNVRKRSESDDETGCSKLRKI
jgi:hypothetical protein